MAGYRIAKARTDKIVLESSSNDTDNAYRLGHPIKVSTEVSLYSLDFFF